MFLKINLPRLKKDKHITFSNVIVMTFTHNDIDVYKSFKRHIQKIGLELLKLSFMSKSYC